MSGVDPRLREHLAVGEPSDEEFVDSAFGLVLRRPPDGEARARALAKLAEGTISRASLLHELITATEFERVRQLDDVIAFAGGARARGERPRHLQAPPATDERLVEVPWVLSRLRSGRVLEVGYAFAEPAYIAALVEAGPGELVGVDLAEAEVPGFETVVADARALPFPDASFDQVLLVSTLEHIGADNEVYGVEGAADDTGRAAALRELRRILRPSGSLLVTVPLGEPGDTAGSGRRTSAAGRGSTAAPDISSRSRRRTSSATTGGVPPRRSTRRVLSTALAGRPQRRCSVPSSARAGCGGSSRPTVSGARPGAGSGPAIGVSAGRSPVSRGGRPAKGPPHWHRSRRQRAQKPQQAGKK